MHKPNFKFSIEPQDFIKMLILSCILAVFSLANMKKAAAQEELEPQGRIEVTELGRPDKNSRVSQNDEKSSKTPKTGRKAAEKYMVSREPAATSKAGPGSHYLALHFGAYASDDAYKWGSEHERQVGKANFGVTYRLGEWVNSADLALRIDYSTYRLAEQAASKLSFLPVVLFPDAASQFPLYFGLGAGLGVFVKQISGESDLSLDYQLLVGARFFDVIQNTGFFLEAGLKNHLMFPNDGQFAGTFVTAGTVFSF